MHQKIQKILQKSDQWHRVFGWSVHDKVTESIYSVASQLTEQVVSIDHKPRVPWELWLDRLLTSRVCGIPFMLGLLACVFWLTIAGANIPSAFLAGILMDPGGLSEWLVDYAGIQHPPGFLSFSLYEGLHALFTVLQAPWWLTGFLVDGVYLGLAWVVAVMLPPMAIFFPLFTLCEDLGLLPRIAFNLDRFFKAVGAHGKQSLTMAMGFGCNAAGVIACRIIDSPRERLIAIVTNNFVPCNGRWPTLIMIASLFVAAAFPPAWVSIVAVGTVTAVTLVGILMTLLISALLSRTLLKGTASSVTLEMPPYRPPQFGRILYTSLIDRTFFVLKRAVICAAPAGGLIWLLGAVPVGDTSLFVFLADLLHPIGYALGLDGVILLAFLFAIPANEIVIPTVIMGYMHSSTMLELDNPAQLFLENGWTMVTAVCVLLFALLHYPCATTTLTIWAETKSVKWTLLSNLLPLVVAIIVCFLVAQLARLFG